jgi:hypothetical protein
LSVGDQADAGAEFLVVAGLDPEAHRKTEPGPDAVEVVLAGAEFHFRQGPALAEVDPHPSRGVGPRGDRAVPTVGL